MRLCRLSFFISAALFLGVYVVSTAYSEGLVREGLTKEGLNDVFRMLQAPEKRFVEKQVSRALIRILEFSSNRLIDIELTEGNASFFKEIELNLKACHADYHGAKGQDVAWIEVYEYPPVKNGVDDADEVSPSDDVYDEAYDKSSSVKVFQGWMFNKYTDVSTVDHAKYDVRLLKCLPSEVLPEAVPVVVPTEEFELEEEGLGGEVSSIAPAIEVEDLLPAFPVF